MRYFPKEATPNIVLAQATAYSKMTGFESGYEYVVLPTAAPTGDLVKYCARTRRHAATIAKGLDATTNVEWLARNYLAIKYIAAATLFYTSAKYAAQRNLNMVVPYELYYCLFTVCRAFILTVPTQQWAGGTLPFLSHKALLREIGRELHTVNEAVSVKVGSLLERLRAIRELFSYRFPSSAIKKERLAPDWKTVRKLATLVAELAQLNSECLHSAIERHSRTIEWTNAQQEAAWPGLEQFCSYELPEGKIHDDEDWYRLEYFFRKDKRPENLFWTGREGLVEELFGAWHSGDASNRRTVYNPDDDSRILFQFQ